MNPGEGLPYLRPDVICTKKKKVGCTRNTSSLASPPWLPLHLACTPLFNPRLSSPAIRRSHHHELGATVPPIKSKVYNFSLKSGMRGLVRPSLAMRHDHDWEAR